MRKFTPLAMLVALLTSLLLGAVAQAGTKDDDTKSAKNYECNQVVGVNVVSCNEVNVGDVEIEIEGNRVLTDNEIEILEDNLNNTKVDVDAIEKTIIKTYKSFNPSIEVTENDITVCILAVCE
jgi:hypothetical protein